MNQSRSYYNRLFAVNEFRIYNVYVQYQEVTSYLFPLTIFVVNVGQDKIHPALSITEEHRVFTLLLLVNL